MVLKFKYPTRAGGCFPRSVRRVRGMEGHLGPSNDSRCGSLDTVPVFSGEPDADAESQAARGPAGTLDEGFWYSGLGEILLFELEVSVIVECNACRGGSQVSGSSRDYWFLHGP